jgi:hypothetical protein
MDAWDLLSVLCGVLALGAAMALSLACARLLRAARALEQATEAFEAAAVPAIEELRSATRHAVGEVDRIDALVEVAGAIGDRVDTATEATYRALTSPVIKGVAFASGTRRAARRLRGREDARGVTTGARR